jgi:O-acetyl-ADP-ribose deacetylase (regulator of RNase III)
VRVTFVDGDLLTQHVDAVVNAANAALAPGGGVCGAIRGAAGPEPFQECARRWPRGIDTGQAVATGSGRLDPPVRVIVHAVGPAFDAVGRDAARAFALVRSAYVAALEAAAEAGARTVALPALSSGIYGVPTDVVARAAVDAVRDVAGRAAAGTGPADPGGRGVALPLDEVRFVFTEPAKRAAFERAWAATAGR